jgi:hypothetical protein
MTAYRTPIWTPLFAEFPPDYVPPPHAIDGPPDAPVVWLVNLLLYETRNLGCSVRVAPHVPTDRAVFFTEGRVLGRETPSAALVAAVIARLRKMARLMSPPPAVGRIFVRFGDYCADFVVHARFTATSERLVVSPIWGAIADPSTMEQVAVNRIYRLLDEARRDEDVAKLLRAREMALRLGGRVGARLSAWLSMELGHREEDREVARAHYERSIRLATDVDEWNVAAALECIGVLRVESGEPPQWAFAPLFSHLCRLGERRDRTDDGPGVRDRTGRVACLAPRVRRGLRRR